MAARSSKQPKPRDGVVHFIETHPAPRGFAAVFSGRRRHVDLRTDRVRRRRASGGDNTHLFVSLVGGAGGWQPAEIRDDFLGVSAPDPDRVYWSQVAVAQGKARMYEPEPAATGSGGEPEGETPAGDDDDDEAADDDLQ